MFNGADQSQKRINPHKTGQQTTYNVLTNLVKLARDHKISLNSALFLIQSYTTDIKHPYTLYRFLFKNNSPTYKDGIIYNLTVKGLINKPDRSCDGGILTDAGKKLVSKYI